MAGGSLGPNELVLPTATSDPSDVAGAMYYNSTNGAPRVYTGSGWVTFGAQLGSAANPANSASELKAAGFSSGSYYIETSNGVVETYCLMDTIDNGGWTLIGKSGGGSQWHDPNNYLKANVNASSMTNLNTISSGGYACIDARLVAGDGSSEIMISNFGLTRWIKVDIHTGATSSTIFNVGVGQSTIANSNHQLNDVSAWNGTSTTAYVNPYMVMSFASHGGSFPAWTQNTAGNTSSNDYRSAIPVANTSHNGFSSASSNNGQDCPKNENDWPGGSISGGAFYGLIWCR